MKTRTKRWDAAAYLDSEEDMAVYLAAAFEDGDPAVVTAALGDIARARVGGPTGRHSSAQGDALG